MPNQMTAAAAEPAQSGGISASLFRGALLIVAIQLVSVVLRYASQVLFARWIGANDYGNYSYALALAQTLATLAVLGLPAGAIRFVPDYVVHRDWARLNGIVLRSRQLVGGAGIGAAALTTMILLVARPARFNLPVLVVGAWLTPFLALSAFESELCRSLFRLALSYSPLMVLDPLVVLVLALVLMRARGHLTAALLIGARCAAILVTVIVQLGGSARVLPGAARRVSPVMETGLWLRVSFPLLLSYSFYALFSRIDVLVLGFFRSPRDVGVYAAATATAALGSVVLGAVNAKGAPMMSAMFTRGDRAGLEFVANTIKLWSFWPSVAVAIAMWIGGARILGVFGAQFSAGYWALAILVLGHVVNSGAGPVGLVALVTGRQNDTARVYGWTLIANAILCFALIPRFGMLGAAAASAATMALWNVWLHFVVSKELRIRLLAGLVDRRILSAGSDLVRGVLRWNQ
jgi:O-antigen/teichoic acid export membrane protein